MCGNDDRDVSHHRTVQPRCQWCGQPLEDGALGRRRRYCSRSCRQRAYEQRNGVTSRAVKLDDQDIILRGEKRRHLLDSMTRAEYALADFEQIIGLFRNDEITADDLDGMLSDCAAEAREAIGEIVSIRKKI